MNYRLVLKTVGQVMVYEALFMALPLCVSIIYGEDANCFAATILLLGSMGAALGFIRPDDKKIRTRDGFALAAMSWIALALFGAVPYQLSGALQSFTDCVFESMSGFTTTGATILTDIESLPRGILFWRSFTQWIGGMGVLIFMMAIMPSMSASSVNLLKAEMPGPSPGKLVPKVRETAKIMYGIYLVMTALCALFLHAFGMSLFDAITHAFTTVATGGFSTMNLSVGAYNSIGLEAVISLFSFLSSFNFMLYFYLLRGDIKSIYKDEELLFFALVVIASVAAITINLTAAFGSVPESLRLASFQVSTIITTTGYSSANFDLWPGLSKTILVALMFMGACAGSTGGGIKIIRVLAMVKAVHIEVQRLIHPRLVKTVKVNGKKIEDITLARIYMYFFIYFAVMLAATLVISADGFDLVTNTTAVISALSNIGPGLAVIGPVGNFDGFSQLSKIALSLCMLAGRLEFLPVLILFAPSLWRKGAVS